MPCNIVGSPQDVTAKTNHAQFFNMNESAELTLKIRSYPAPTSALWTSPNVDSETPGAIIYQEEGVYIVKLTIERMHEDEYGTYRCEIKNENPESLYVNLTVYETRKFSQK